MRLRIRSLIESLEFKNNIQKNPCLTVTKNRIFTQQDKDKTILIPYFSEFYSPLVPALFKMAGYNIENLCPSDRLSQEYGLKYVNNEVCFPATVIVGDIIKALKSGKYDLDNIAIGMTQTGGQCRATNYISLIKNAMYEAGYSINEVDPDYVVVGESPGSKYDRAKKLGIATLTEEEFMLLISV